MDKAVEQVELIFGQLSPILKRNRRVEACGCSGWQRP